MCMLSPPSLANGDWRQILAHFNHLYALDTPDWAFHGYCYGTCSGKRSRMPHTEFHAFTPHDYEEDDSELTIVERRRRKDPRRVMWRPASLCDHALAPRLLAPACEVTRCCCFSNSYCGVHVTHLLKKGYAYCKGHVHPCWR